MLLNSRRADNLAGLDTLRCMRCQVPLSSANEAGGAEGAPEVAVREGDTPARDLEDPVEEEEDDDEGPLMVDVGSIWELGDAHSPERVHTRHTTATTTQPEPPPTLRHTTATATQPQPLPTKKTRHITTAAAPQQLLLNTLRHTTATTTATQPQPSPTKKPRYTTDTQPKPPPTLQHTTAKATNKPPPPPKPKPPSTLRHATATATQPKPPPTKKPRYTTATQPQPQQSAQHQYMYIAIRRHTQTCSIQGRTGRHTVVIYSFVLCLVLVLVYFSHTVVGGEATIERRSQVIGRHSLCLADLHAHAVAPCVALVFPKLPLGEKRKYVGTWVLGIYIVHSHVGRRYTCTCTMYIPTNRFECAVG